MLIHSNFHDYYDSASAFGVDSSCHYIRNKREIKDLLLKKVINFLRPNHKETFLYGDSLSHFDYIFYCGYLYKIAKVYVDVSRSFRYIHTNEEFSTLIDSGIKIYSSPNKNYVNTWGGGFWDNKIPDLTPTRISDDLFFELGVPCFSLSCTKLEINPRLKDFEFYKFKSAPIAFQEIHGYISGVLGAQHPKIINISDIVKLEKHGFDKKMSFRKRKEG